MRAGQSNIWFKSHFVREARAFYPQSWLDWLLLHFTVFKTSKTSEIKPRTTFWKEQHQKPSPTTKCSPTHQLHTTVNIILYHKRASVGFKVCGLCVLQFKRTSASKTSQKICAHDPNSTRGVCGVVRHLHSSSSRLSNASLHLLPLLPESFRKLLYLRHIWFKVQSNHIQASLQSQTEDTVGE